MNSEDLFDQNNILDLSFFNFRNAITAAYYANSKLEILRVNDNFVKLSVVDSGVGIARSDLKNIQEANYQAEDYEHRSSSGLGLGLYIASHKAARIGAKIDVKSKLNEGSTFSLIIPRN